MERRLRVDQEATLHLDAQDDHDRVERMHLLDLIDLAHELKMLVPLTAGQLHLIYGQLLVDEAATIHLDAVDDPDRVERMRLLGSIAPAHRVAHQWSPPATNDLPAVNRTPQRFAHQRTPCRCRSRCTRSRRQQTCLTITLVRLRRAAERRQRARTNQATTASQAVIDGDVARNHPPLP